MQEMLEGWGLSKEAIAQVLGSLYGLIAQYAGAVIGAIVLIVVVLILSGWVRSTVEKQLTRINFDKTLTRFFGAVSRWLVLLLGFVGLLSIFGVETTSVAGVLTGTSLAVGLAFQGSLSNVAAGIMLLVFRPFTVGQVVSVAGQTGAVEEISIFTTTMNTPDNQHVIIPNGQVFGATIVNLSHNEHRRVDINIGVDYTADIDETRKVLEKAIKKVKSRATERDDHAAFLASFGGSSVDWQVRVFSTPDNYWAVYEETMKAVKEELDAAGIDIPYPHTVIMNREA